MITAPPNPRAAEAARDMRAYNAPLLANPQAVVPQPPSDLLDRVFEKWPDMERYRATATIERIDYETNGARRWCWCVTVNV